MPSTDDRARPEVGAPATSGAAEATVVAVVVAAGLVLRFLTTSPLWLDEALSVNIARLPVGDIPDALRQDGHPPLYYVLLHAWMQLFGEGDTAVRALSGVLSVATLPLAWVAGRRRAGRVGALATVATFALTPFVIRYATESRMYALVMLLALAGFLLVEDLLREAVPRKVAALTIVTAALLWSHYWALWLGAAAAALVGWQAWRHAGAIRRRALTVLAALAGGLVLFLPWVPSMLDQADSTGTPWADPATPTRVVQTFAEDLGGGDFPESISFTFVLLLLAAIGIFAQSVRGSSVALHVDVRTVPGVRAEMSVVALTLSIGVLAGYATASTFAPRYAATFVPMLLVAAAHGLTRLPSRSSRAFVGALLVVLGLAGGVRNVVEDRTQAEALADAIDAAATDADVVVFCPDQLGPAVDRALDVPEQRLVFPTFAGPERIDWRDYASRNRDADVGAFAEEVLDRAASASVWVVWSGSYRTLEDACPALIGELSARRSGGEVVGDGGSTFFEHAALWRFDPR